MSCFVFCLRRALNIEIEVPQKAFKFELETYTYREYAIFLSGWQVVGVRVDHFIGYTLSDRCSQYDIALDQLSRIVVNHKAGHAYSHRETICLRTEVEVSIGALRQLS